ncbi:uncharacterized protein MELLADRAFT_73331 [Melampsora larici-populina 98AG31]|uniref:RRM domain-containing protein n=1 Tax=Melampsora larici-populina (strain 98AG31 / pathotype 3-4-7) TaxID=747676 RepID=F4S6L4_MELLP|nr:uncharacterized protein MELLADRAFT_73331 [Melampsora larici-populina 98AG31]EGF99708.1 hypothetical protein MELLADRAFT_73331 [Melampsora larici-populina 98AG31]
MLVDRLPHRHDSFHRSGRVGSDHRPSSSFRSRPYSLPHHLQTPAGNSDEQWSHDLFESDSDVYAPKIRFKVDLPTSSEPVPSPSLRPFGKSHNVTSIIVPSTNTRLFASTGLLDQPTVVSQVQREPVQCTVPPLIEPVQTTRAPLSLLSRIQTAARPPVVHQPLELIPNAITTSTFTNRINRTEPTPTPSEIRKARESHEQKVRTARAQKSYDIALQKYLNGPVILEVSNLADGTSAEDVKTAFADFGEIQECSTEEGPKQGIQPTLKARMIFINRADADKAVEALNGVLADGLLLSVKVVGRPGKKPDRADFLPPSTSHMVSTPSVVPVTVVQPLVAKVDVEMSSAAEDVVMEIDTPAPLTASSQSATGKLRSEALVYCDPRASLQSEPQTTPMYKSPPARAPIPIQAQPPPPQASRSLLTDRVQPATKSSHNTATDNLMNSIGISPDAMKLMSRLQVVNQPDLKISNHHHHGHGGRGGRGGMNSGKSRGANGNSGNGNGKPSLLARIGKN